MISDNSLHGHLHTWATQGGSTYATTAPKKGTFTMWSVQIVLLTRGFLSYNLTFLVHGSDGERSVVQHLPTHTTSRV